MSRTLTRAAALPAKLLPATLVPAGLVAVLLVVLALAGGAAAAAGAANPPAQGPPRTVVILVDSHTSHEDPLASQHQAVLAYARALPAGVRTGLIIFSTGWKLVLRPTANRAALAAAVRGIVTGGATTNGLPGALAAAAALVRGLPAASQSRFAVFSNAEELRAALPRAAVPTDVVLWHADGDDRTGALQALARASGGRVVPPAGAVSLAAAPASRGKARPPAIRPSGHPAANPAPHPAPHPAQARGSHLSGSLIAVLATVFVALLLLALLAVGSLHQHDMRRDLTDRIARYGPRHEPASPAGDGKVASAAVGWVTRLLQSTNSEPKLAKRLDLAGIGRKPAEWALLGACLSLVLAALLTVLIGNLVLGVLAGALIGWLAMRLILSLRIVRRRAAFSEQLPNVLQLVAGSLQSGFSLAQALDAAAREETQPSAGEFSRALGEARLGADLGDALEGVATRMDSKDLRWTVMAIRIQREVGGNLAEVLQNTVGTMRERANLRRHVRALSAEGRLSAYILVALPVLIGGWLFYSSPHYMHPLYTNPVGVAMLGGAVVLVVLGALWMRALIKVEV